MGEVVQLFSNPHVRRGKRRRIEALARALEARGATVLRSESAGAPPRIAPEADHVCVAGGDGTVRHVAAAVVRSGRQVAMSIYPAGTINLLAMEAGYPRKPDDFAHLVLQGGTRRHHYPVAMGDGYFFACAGVGPDSFVVARTSAQLKRAIGRFAYVAAALKQLLDWQRHRIRLEANGIEVQCEAFYVAKGRYYAGRWSLAQAARVHDPVLHVVALRRARRRDYLQFLATLAAHRDVSGLRNVEVFTCTKLDASAAAPLPVQADGDIVETLPATLAVRDAPLVFC